MPIPVGRTLVVTIGKALSLLWLVLLMQFSLYQAQKFPPIGKYHNLNNEHKETFQNSYILVPEVENKIYCYQGRAKNVTFTYVSGGMMNLVVTPCASEIQWTLFYKVETQHAYKLHGQPKRIRPPVQIAGLKHETRQVFHQVDAPPGQYILSIVSIHSDSIPKFLVTSNISFDSMYPELPSDTAVRASVRRKKLVVNWAPSPMANHWTHPVKYCVSISRIKNFKTHCSAIAHKNGDKKPKFAEFGFDFEKKENKKLRRRAKPIRKVKKKYLFYKCVMGQTSFTYKKLRRGKKYFVDVFMEDKNSKGWSTYTGTSVERKKKNRVQKRHFAVLNMGKTRTVNLKHTRGVQINVNKTLSNLVIDAVTCGEGKLKVVLYYKRKILRSESTDRRLKRINLESVKAGTYLMAFPGKRKKSVFVSISASAQTKSKVLLPKSMTVTPVRQGLSSCSNITLQWMESRTKQTYCLYKQILAESNKSKRSGSRRQRCLSPSERSKSQLVFCDRRRPENPKKVRVFTVAGLSPATSYRFDLFIGNRRSGMVPYHSLKETTKISC